MGLSSGINYQCRTARAWRTTSIQEAAWAEVQPVRSVDFAALPTPGAARGPGWYLRRCVIHTGCGARMEIRAVDLECRPRNAKLNYHPRPITGIDDAAPNSYSCLVHLAPRASSWWFLRYPPLVHMAGSIQYGEPPILLDPPAGIQHSSRIIHAGWKPAPPWTCCLTFLYRSDARISGVGRGS